MASNWIKVEVITPDKPEIFQISEILNIDPDSVLGKLVRLWVWADQQTLDGNAGSVTKSAIDRIAFITGFADALISVGWLVRSEDGLVFPNFERHNGESSKKRALTNRRVAKHRKSETPKVTQPALQKALPEEEEEEEVKRSLLARAGDSQSGTGTPPTPPNHIPGISEPIGKFTMYPNWMPSEDFVNRARTWGIAIPAEGYVETDLAEFVDFWLAEGKVFQHVQWEQKFARHVEYHEKKRVQAERNKRGELDWDNTDWAAGLLS